MKRILLIGASGGIGNKTAKLLLDNGYEVIGTYYQHEDRVENLSKLANYSSTYLDLKTPDSIKKLTNYLEDKQLYAIINCAGIVRFEGESAEEDIDIWNEIIAINLSSNYILAKLLLGNLEENGSFIMISSTDAYYGGGLTASYAASKAGVNSLTKSLSLLFQDKKIRVNSIAPGWVSTPMIEGESEEFYKKLAETNPRNRIAKPADVAKLIKFLLSPDSDYINGQVITLDGGYTNQDSTLLIEEDIKK